MKNKDAYKNVKIVIWRTHRIEVQTDFVSTVRAGSANQILIFALKCLFPTNRNTSSSSASWPGRWADGYSLNTLPHSVRDISSQNQWIWRIFPSSNRITDLEVNQSEHCWWRHPFASVQTQELSLLDALQWWFPLSKIGIKRPDCDPQ